VSTRGRIAVAGASAGIAIAAALPFITYSITDEGLGGVLMFFGVPGILLGAMVSGNPHDPPAWLMILFNWIFYSLAISLLIKLWRRYRAN
jgi:hypothetical protein